jgi:excisionase family DNA binding protein
MARDLNDALRTAISFAKVRQSPTVEPDDILLGALTVLSRFAIAHLGPLNLDLEPFGVSSKRAPTSTPTPAKPSYSDQTVALLDAASAIALADGSPKVGLSHLLACFADVETGLMGQLRQRYGLDSAAWRTALSRLLEPEDQPAAPVQPAGRPYYTPEEAAAYLGVHIQTIRGYIKSAKLPALRIAGERAIRLRREDLDALLEPLQPQEIDKHKP